MLVSAMSQWDAGGWGTPELIHVCSKGWHEVLGMLCGMLCFSQEGPCPCAVLLIAPKS